MRSINFNCAEKSGELVKSISTDWSVIDYFKIPYAYSFECEWEYTVQSYAGNRLYKYPETRKVTQKAAYVSVTRLKSDNSIHEIKVCDEDKVEICRKNLHGENLIKYEIIINVTKSSVKTFIKKDTEMSAVKLGDHVICFDEYSHDYVEHELVVESIENETEDGLCFYGRDLTFPEDEFDNYIAKVTCSNFLRIKEE